MNWADRLEEMREDLKTFAKVQIDYDCEDGAKRLLDVATSVSVILNGGPLSGLDEPYEPSPVTLKAVEKREGAPLFK